MTNPKPLIMKIPVLIEKIKEVVSSSSDFHDEEYPRLFAAGYSLLDFLEQKISKDEKTKSRVSDLKAIKEELAAFYFPELDGPGEDPVSEKDVLLSLDALKAVLGLIEKGE